jgi:GTPase KRas protein
MREQYMKFGEGFLLVYSVTDRNSFQELESFVDTIQWVKETEQVKKVPIVLVGNKCDLVGLRQVPTEEGESYANKLEVKFLECSAFTRQNVESAFFELVRIIRQTRTVVKGRNSATKKRRAGGRCLLL